MLKYLNKVEKYDKWGKYQKAGLYYVKIYEQGGKIGKVSERPVT